MGWSTLGEVWGEEVGDLRVEGFGKCARRGRRFRWGGFGEVWGGEVGDLRMEACRGGVGRRGWRFKGGGLW